MARISVVIDGQWGSTGKGKLAGYLCQHERPDIAVCDYMPNAGHTVVFDDGTEKVFRQIPVAAAFGVPCCIGPHAAIDVGVFERELPLMAPGTELYIHPLATVVSRQDRENEAYAAGHIATTAKGGHSANALKSQRSRMAQLAKDNSVLAPFIDDTYAKVQDVFYGGGNVLVETAQGFDLGLNHGVTYPHVTGRDCLVGRALDNAGLPCVTGVEDEIDVVASLRTYPIRVGSTEKGWSGPSYSGQRELTWEDVAVMKGPHGKPVVPELTTVTRRVRRVFDFNFQQIERFVRFVRPTRAFLNFCNYLPPESKLIDGLGSMLRAKGCSLQFLGWGPKQGDMWNAGLDSCFGDDGLSWENIWRSYSEHPLP